MRNVGNDSHVVSGGIGIGGGVGGDLPVRTGSGSIAVKPLAAGDSYVGPRSEPKVQEPAQVETPVGTKNALALGQAILLYNSDCPVCQKIAGWVIANDDPKNGGGQKIDERPIGYDPEALKKLNPELTIWDAYSTIHVVMPDGSMKVGGEAIAEVLRRLPDTSWATGLLGLSVFGWRPFQSALNAGYTILDKLRPALGCTSCGTPVPWWGKPVAWAFNAYQRLTGSGPKTT
jgi:predicted DCC family thiol-disulfide oxidoreductase YuxK